MKKTKLNSLTFKFTLFVLIPIIVATFLTVFLMVNFLNSEIAEKSKEALDNTLYDCNGQLESATSEKMILAKKTAYQIETLQNSDTSILINTLISNLFIDRSIYGASVILKNKKEGKTTYSYIRCYNNKNILTTRVEENTDSATFIEKYRFAKEYLLQPELLKHGIWTEPYFRKSEDSTFVITYSEPIFIKNKFRGITSVDVTINELTGFFGQMRQINEYHQKVLVENNDSVLIYAQDHPEAIGKKLSEVLKEDSALDRKSVTFLTDALNKQNLNVIDFYDNKSNERFIVTSRESKFLNWKIIAYTRYKNILEVYNPLIGKLVILLVSVILILIIIFAWVSNRLVVRPLKKMSATTQKIADGDYSYKVVIKRNDEIGMLADNFRKMVKKLKEREESLKQKNIELEEANKQLKELDKAKSQFLKLISHEIRTPLNGIIGSTYFLNDMVEDESLKEFIAMLKESADRLERVATNSLLVTQLETKNQDKKYKPVDAVKIIENSLEKLNDFIAEKGVEIKSNLVEKTVLVDEELAGKAVFEVLHNAVKFTEDKKVTIETESDNFHYTVTVINKSKNIPEEKLAKMTRPFGLSADHTDKNFGLGLTVARLCMEAMQGNLTVTSENNTLKVSLLFKTA